MLPGGRSIVVDFHGLLFLRQILHESALRLIRVRHFAMYRSIQRFVDVVLLVVLAIQDQVEHIVRILLPFRGKEWYHIADTAFHLRFRGVTLTSLRALERALKVTLNIHLHARVLRCIITLLKVALFAKYFASERHFVTRGWTIGYLLRLQVLVPLKEQTLVYVYLHVDVAVSIMILAALTRSSLSISDRWFLDFADLFVLPRHHKLL